MRVLDRRTFLRSTGVAIGLPLLDATRPTFAAESSPPQRLVLIALPLSLYGPNFFPEDTGRNYTPSRYLKFLAAHRERFTVFSGLSHKYPTGHHPSVALYSGVPAEWIRSPADIRNGITLDQEVAARVGDQTRFPSLVWGHSYFSFNRRGVNIPSERNSSAAFKELFIQGTPTEEAQQLARIQEGASILDDVRDQLKSINRRLGELDRQRVDLYLSSVREAEQRLQQDERWCKRPKPKVDYRLEPQDATVIKRTRQWYDIMHLALQTDSTRVISFGLDGYASGVDGVTLSPHDASHHGKDPEKLDQLALIEDAEMKVFAEFLDKLAQSSEGSSNLLDNTAVLMASNMGDASSHANDNMPVLLAGGGFNHQGHVAFDRHNNTLLSNLFVRMLQQLGIEANTFGASDGVISVV